MTTKAEKKAAQEANDFLKGLLAQHGVIDPEADLVVEGGEPIQSRELDDSPQRIMFRAQGVLRSMEFPTEERLTRLCKSKKCGDVFITNYAAVAYCSILCCEQDLKDYFGLAWRPNARIKKEKWEVRTEPSIIPIQALRAMKLIVAQAESDLGHPIPTEQESSSLLSLQEPQEEKPSLASEILPALSLVSDTQKSSVPLEHSIEEEDDLLAFLYADVG